MNIPYLLFDRITNNFSPDNIIGSGGFGNVYKQGVLHNNELIAVKLLHPVEALDGRLFNNEVGNLFRVDHPNIIGLLGYCDEIHSKYVELNGQKVSSKYIYRVLCFEYFPSGSLHKHIWGYTLAPKWGTRYSIIKGICEGLNYLHGCEPPILHLDLKPANILLDNSMIPKLADFGLSRLFAESHTHVTQQKLGTEKYMPPEYINGGNISAKNDVYSLGVVMIEIMVGPDGYSMFQEMHDIAQFKKEVLTKLGSMIEPTSECPSEQLLQMDTCIDTAVCCVDPQREKRPTIQSILKTLNKTETGIPDTQLEVFPLSPALDIKNSLAGTLKMMTAEMDNKKKSMEEASIIESTKYQETTSNVEEGLIIGRTEEKQQILSILCESSSKEVVILPIYGIGGIGKTALAQLVFNDTQFDGYSRVWVYVSEILDLYKIGNSIISQLSKEITTIVNMQIINDSLKNLCVGKNILIVLDGLWEEKPHALDKLKAMLRLGRGSKVIIVTTRDESIARKICSTVKNVPYKLEILTDDMCWIIMKQKSDFENQLGKEQLEKIGKDIAIKCGGVALAAQSLGYMLREMTSDQWESVRDSHIWNSSISEDPSITTHEVLASLRLSYYHMDKFLKLCFSYCAIFPKGQNISKYDLIHQWIALEFKPSEIFDPVENCQQYIRKLLGMSFLQYSVAPLDGQEDKDGTLFMMHDLVHDLARAMLADKFSKNANVVGSSCQYALLTDPSKPLQSYVNSPENIKVLHFRDCAEKELHDGAILPAKYLVVLDLRGCGILKLPDSICQLKQLRYLHAPGIQGRMVPRRIAELSKLTYLNLRGARGILALPASIGDLKDLLHLDLRDCWSICEYPVSFAELKQLVHLNLSRCSMVILLEALAGFTKLQYLNLAERHVDYMEDHVKQLPEVIGNLTKLRYLNLSRCAMLKGLSEDTINCLFASITTLYNLEYLNLSDCKKLTSIPESIGKLTKLHTLDLSGCSKINMVPAIIAKMDSLKIVTLMNFEASPMNLDAPRIRQLFPIASLPDFVVHATPSEHSSNIFLLEPTNPVRLRIIRLENVMSVEEAQSIKLKDKQGMAMLSLDWTIDCGTSFVDDRDLLEKLVPPNNIWFWHIGGYRSHSFPNWLMGIGHYLPNLSMMNLADFPNCNNLPPLGLLPKLESLRLFRFDRLEEWDMTHSSGETGANEPMFPKLKSLKVIHCAKLRIKPCLPRAVSVLHIQGSDNMLTSCSDSMSQTGASSSSPVTEIHVTECIVPLHQWRLLHHISDLHTLTITNCSDLSNCSQEIIQCLSSLESLNLSYGDNDRAELPAWLAELRALRVLSISHPKLKRLNDNARQLTRLTSLSLLDCGRMASVPEWLGELISLQFFKIAGCKWIRSLPNSIQQLVKLERLSISGCHTLVKWCESEENKAKLAHIREKVRP
ncbi:unnamed protein product [Alopecurus aequalis]